MKAFIEWGNQNGFSPELWLDRFDNSKGYSPDNCRWVTPKQQANNRDNNTTNHEKETRICFVCHEEKPLTEFYKTKNGNTHYCKKCRYVLYLRYKNKTTV
jgi:hypothetical protein